MKQTEVTSKQIMARIKKVKGQMRGIEKMVTSGESCAAVVQQVLAAKNALSSLAVTILYDEVCQRGIEDQKPLLEKIVREV